MVAVYGGASISDQIRAIKKGANIIFVITNEGWWGNTHGHIQLNHLSQLRAIENRRSVVRSAITNFLHLRVMPMFRKNMMQQCYKKAVHNIEAITTSDRAQSETHY